MEVIETANLRRRAPAGGGPRSAGNLLADWRWTAQDLPRLAARERADLIHHPLPAHARFTTVPQVITVHDLSFERLPQYFAPAFRRFAHRSHRAAALSADAVICVSETTASDASELWRVPAERIVVAPHGPGQPLPSPYRPRLGNEHFLYVGDDEPRKNLDTLLAAHRIYRDATGGTVPLVLAGSVDRGESGVLVERQPSNQRLAELYAGAVALVQPSRYEGFGMTALEAMSVGTPVIAASAPGLLEVCGDAAIYVDPSDAQGLAVAMARIAADPELRGELSDRGRQRASSFSWPASAQSHLKAYELALARSR